MILSDEDKIVFVCDSCQAKYFSLPSCCECVIRKGDETTFSRHVLTKESHKSNSVYVCPECDIAGCKHTKASQQEPDLWLYPDHENFDCYGSIYTYKDSDTCIPVWLSSPPQAAAIPDGWTITKIDNGYVLKDRAQLDVTIVNGRASSGLTFPWGLVQNFLDDLLSAAPKPEGE
jgi:hypothetical protein